MAITFPAGFNVVANEPIDNRIILEKSQFLTAEEDLALPSLYFCICSTDQNIYLFNSNNSVDPELGKFRLYQDSASIAEFNTISGRLNTLETSAMKTGGVIAYGHLPVLYADGLYYDSDINADNVVLTNDLAAVATSGNYNDLTNKPTIPDVTNVMRSDSDVEPGYLSELWVDGLYHNSGISITDIARTSGLAAVATSGNYNDLTNKPTIANQRIKLANLTPDANATVLLTAGNNIQLHGGVSQNEIVIAANDVPTVTTAANGLMTAVDKIKLDTVEAGAEKNQPAFSAIRVGHAGIITADSSTDFFSIMPGSNIITSIESSKINIDAVNTWQPNTANQEGYVASTGGAINQVWKTDENGIPAWRNEKTYPELAAGYGIQTSTLNNTITISNSGVRGIYTGSSYGTILVNTNGLPSEVAIAGLKSAAYTNSTDYALYHHFHGTIASDGAIQEAALENGAALVVADPDTGCPLKTAITFSSNLANQYKVLSQNGNWLPLTARSEANKLVYFDSNTALLAASNFSPADIITTDASTTAHGLMSANDKIKLNGIQENATVNVQSDWNETDTTSDAYILNKPAMPDMSDVMRVESDQMMTPNHIPVLWATGCYGDNGIDADDIVLNTDLATTSANGLMTASDKIKLNSIQENANVNVQSDWNETNTTSDAYILNKPTNLSNFTNDTNFISSSIAAATFAPLGLKVNNKTLTNSAITLTGEDIKTSPASNAPTITAALAQLQTLKYIQLTGNSGTLSKEEQNLVITFPNNLNIPVIWYDSIDPANYIVCRYTKYDYNVDNGFAIYKGENVTITISEQDGAWTKS